MRFHSFVFCVVAVVAQEPPPTIVQPVISAEDVGPGQAYSVASYQIPEGFTGKSSGNSLLHSWRCEGSCEREADGSYTLLKGVAGEAGALWHPVRLDGKPRPIEIEFDIKCSGNSYLSDGLGFWIAQSTSIEQLAHYPHFDVWNLINFDPFFRGTGLALATRDRSDSEKQSISLLTNDGLNMIDVTRGVPSRTGVYFQWIASSIGFKLVLGDDAVTCYIRTAGSKEYQRAFSVALSDMATPDLGGWLVISGGNSRRPSTKQVRGLLNININRLRVSTLDSSFAVSPQTSSLHKTSERLRANLQSGDVAGSLQIMSQILTDHLLPRQELALMALQNFTTTQHQLDGLNQLVAQQAAEITDLRELISSGARGQVHDTVRAAQSISFWASVGLNGVLIVSALLVYKRMGDWEKKHYL